MIDSMEWQNAIADEVRSGPSMAAVPPASYNPRYRDNAIVELTFAFSLAIWDLAEELEGKRKYVVAEQLLRSGTAIGALVREAQNAESMADFIHKMKVAMKEADGTEHWLLLCHAKETAGTEQCLQKLAPILRILNKIIATSKTKLGT